MKTKVLLDTNFLLTMVRHKIRAIQELRQNLNAELYTLSGVIDEVDVLAGEDKKIAKEAKIIKEIIKKENIIALESKMNKVDDEMVARSNEYVIATNDKQLRQRVREKGGKTAYIRSLTFVEADSDSF
jgi:rRNA-processing protein FCF1